MSNFLFVWTFSGSLFITVLSRPVEGFFLLRRSICLKFILPGLLEEFAYELIMLSCRLATIAGGTWFAR